MKAKRLAVILGSSALISFAIVLSFPAPLTAQATGGSSSWGFALSNLDRTCKPCDDFYQFAMGGWRQANPIPPEYATWGTFAQLRDGNLTALRGILETAAQAHAAAAHGGRAALAAAPAARAG